MLTATTFLSFHSPNIQGGAVPSHHFAPDGFTLRKIDVFSDLTTGLGGDVARRVSLWPEELWQVPNGLPLAGEDEEQDDTEEDEK
jgi:hypothetical protein